MPITFVAATQLTGTGSTSHVLTLPSYQADDIIIVSASWTTPGTVTDDLGFTDVFTDVWGDPATVGMSLMWKRMMGSEGSTVTLTTGNSRSSGISAQCFRGVDATTAFDAAPVNWSGATQSSPFPAPSITTVTNGAMIVVGAANNSGDRRFRPADGSPFVEDTDTNAFLTGGKANTTEHWLQTTAGATGTIPINIQSNLDADLASAYTPSAWTMALRPASSTTVPAAIANLAGTAGNAQVPLTWTAPADGGASITDYIVQWRVAP